MKNLVFSLVLVLLTMVASVSYADADKSINRLVDGTTDMGLITGIGHAAVWMNGDASSGFGSPTVVAYTSGARSISIGDISNPTNATGGDGYLDAAWVETSGAYWRTGDGTTIGSAIGTIIVGPSISAVSLGDINGDGLMDAVYGDSDSSVRWRKGEISGGVFGFGAISVVAYAGGGIGDVVSYDCDRDGDLDIAWKSDGTFGGWGSSWSGVYWRENLGGGNVGGSVHTIVGDVPEIKEFDLGDIDGDGKVDCVYATDTYLYKALDVTDYSGGGFGYVKTGLSGAAGLSLGDWEGDGDLDLLWNSGNVYLDLNNGSGTFTDKTYYVWTGDVRSLDFPLAVPEPTTVVLLGLGSLLLRRKK